MNEKMKYAALIAVLLLSNAAFGQVRDTKVRPTAGQSVAITSGPTQANLSAANAAKKKATIAQRQRVRSKLPAGSSRKIGHTGAKKAQQDTPMGFDGQNRQLQSQMQSENRSYTAISNAMKTKHDTVKNSIDNVR